MASEQPGPEAVAAVGEEGGAGDVQTVRGQVSLADFPAVSIHISHWYLSWNTLTNPSYKSQLSRAIN